MGDENSKATSHPERGPRRPIMARKVVPVTSDNSIEEEQSITHCSLQRVAPSRTAWSPLVGVSLHPNPCLPAPRRLLTQLPLQQSSPKSQQRRRSQVPVSIR